MRRPRRLVAGLLGILTAGMAAVSGCMGLTAPERIDLTPEEWREDLAFIARELPRRHANAYHHVSKEQFEQSVAELHARIPSLAGSEVVVEMVRLVAMVGDLHTRLRLPRGFERLPLEFEWFENELRITAASAEYSGLLGKRIAAVGTTPVEQADRTVRALIPQAENEWTFAALTPAFLVRPQVLHAMGLIGTPGPVELRITEADEPPVARIVESRPGEAAPQLIRAPTAPHLETEPEESFWWTALGEGRTVYIRFRSYENVGPKSKRLSSFLEERQPHKIIIDMRNNLGGDFTKVREHLIPELEPHRIRVEPRPLFVIINRRTLSAAMTNAIDLKTRLGAVLVGEPIGERPNSYQEGREVRLPNSHLTLSYSTRYYKFLDDDEPTLRPDIEVQFDWLTFSEGRDPALEAIVAQSP